MFRRYVEAELDRVRNCPQAAMLSERVYKRLDESLSRTVGFVAGDTVTNLVAEVLADENPIAASFPDLITKAERERAGHHRRARGRTCTCATRNCDRNEVPR